MCRLIDLKGVIYITQRMTYRAEFLGLFPKKDNSQIGEMYYRCSTDDNKSYIIKIPRVILDIVEITINREDYMYSRTPIYLSNDSYLKLRIEPENNTFYEIIMEDENMPTGKYSDLFKSLDELTLTWKYAPKFDKNEIKDVIYNDPATIVFWKDGTKTVVKCQKDKGDTYNPELGLAMCIIKKMCNNKGNYNDVFNKWLPEGWK